MLLYIELLETGDRIWIATTSEIRKRKPIGEISAPVVVTHLVLNQKLVASGMRQETAMPNRKYLKLGARVKVVNPDHRRYEQFGNVTATNYDNPSVICPLNVQFGSHFEAFQAWELMEWPSYGVEPDAECGEPEGGWHG